jgi:hypothetical protein
VCGPCIASVSVGQEANEFPLAEIFFSRSACLSGQTGGGQSRGQTVRQEHIFKGLPKKVTSAKKYTKIPLGQAQGEVNLLFIPTRKNLFLPVRLLVWADGRGTVMQADSADRAELQGAPKTKVTAAKKNTKIPLGQAQGDAYLLFRCLSLICDCFGCEHVSPGFILPFCRYRQYGGSRSAGLVQLADRARIGLC